MSVARSSSGTLVIGRIAYRREGVDGSGQRGRSVIYDCLVCEVDSELSYLKSHESLISQYTVRKYAIEYNAKHTQA